MTPSAFFEHWGLAENPFRGEEARQDGVFARLVSASAGASGVGIGLATPISSGASSGLATISPSLASRAQHNDYEKVVGDMARVSSSVAFGEKGSGKTALRLQIQHAAALHNAASPSEKVLLVGHDDLTAFLERLHARLVRQTRKGESTPSDSFKQTRLVDHADAVLHAVVPRLVDALIENGPGLPNAAPGALPDPTVLDLGPEPRRTARAQEKVWRRDLLVLQSIYDRGDGAGDRAKSLRRGIGVRRPLAGYVGYVIARVGWLAPVITLLWIYHSRRTATGRDLPDTTTGFLGWREWLGLTGTPDGNAVGWATFFFGSLMVWGLFLVQRWWTHRVMFNRVTRRVYKQVRVTGRGEHSLAASLHELPTGWRGGGVMPVTDAEATRMAMIQRLRRVLKPFGYASLLVVVDRVDEPALIAGDVERMRTVVWPLFNNAFLQQDGVAVKMLLPIELRHALMRESAAFFQQARMDKQNMVEQLGWTGPMLYDLCDTRIAACRLAVGTGASVGPGRVLTLCDLFAPEITRDALIEALEQMRQPRDAFKLVYACIIDHCARTVEARVRPADQDDAIGERASADVHAGYRVSKQVFDETRKAQAERLRQLAMGVRPA